AGRGARRRHERAHPAARNHSRRQRRRSAIAATAVRVPRGEESARRHCVHVAAMTGLLITLVLFPLAGCIAGRRTFSESFLLGVGVLGAALFIGGVFSVPLVVTPVVVMSVAVVRFVMQRGWSRGESFAIAPTIVLIAPLASLTFIAATTPLIDSDCRAFCRLKAKVLALDRLIP